jgi:hypothetical protein
MYIFLLNDTSLLTNNLVSNIIVFDDTSVLKDESNFELTKAVVAILLELSLMSGVLI